MAKHKRRPKKMLPLVSVCTPTFNRRPFIPSMLKCFNHQTYPKNRIEWIILDDGTDKIYDLVKDHPNVKYYAYDNKLTLGKKRNLMHEKATGDIIVYMDDDDYYPPTRISHAVTKLRNSQYLLAGASEIYIYFKHISQLWQFGPYGPTHATAGTFAFKKELLLITKYDDDVSFAEERSFLKSYSIPMVQLEPKHTILVFSHTQNTFDKKELISSGPSQFSKISDKIISYFVPDPSITKWFLKDIDAELDVYKPGEPEMKPDVVVQMNKRNKLMDAKRQSQVAGVSLTPHQNGQNPIRISPQQISQILNKQQNDILLLQNTISELSKELETEKTRNQLLSNTIDKFNTSCDNV